MEASPAVTERLICFYRDLVGLTFIEDTLNPGRLRFRSSRLELTIALRDRPRIEPTRRRAVLSVRSLEETARVLEEEGIGFRRLSGWNWTDRRLSLLDPGGNRVELKQEWRLGVFPTVGRQAREVGSGATDGAGGKKNKKDGDTTGE